MTKESFNYPKNRKSRARDLTGRKFSLLTVISRKEERNENKDVVWDCLCECGKTTTVSSRSLVHNQTKSCGCIRKYNHRTKGGASLHPLWGIYNQMVSRCHNEKHPSYFNYGSRGIIVCSRWRESAFNFYEDMGECPPDMSLERINNNLGYSPENCKWETKSRQQYNQRMDPNNTSGRTGVYWRKDREKWFAQIDFERKTVRLGHFVNYEDACKARAEAELKYFGFIKE
jgi:hypothetical protein